MVDLQVATLGGTTTTLDNPAVCEEEDRVYLGEQGIAFGRITGL